MNKNTNLNRYSRGDVFDGLNHGQDKHLSYSTKSLYSGTSSGSYQFSKLTDKYALNSPTISEKN